MADMLQRAYKASKAMLYSAQQVKKSKIVCEDVPTKATGIVHRGVHIQAHDDSSKIANTFSEWLEKEYWLCENRIGPAKKKQKLNAGGGGRSYNIKIMHNYVTPPPSIFFFVALWEGECSDSILQYINI